MLFLHDIVIQYINTEMTIQPDEIIEILVALSSSFNDEESLLPVVEYN